MKLTVKQYAELQGVKTSAIYNRMSPKRGTLKYKVIDGLTYVYPASDKTIKKPRKNKSNE